MNLNEIIYKDFQEFLEEAPPQFSKYSQQKYFEYFDKLNQDKTHYNNTNDICTPMGCVKEMVDQIPAELWERKELSILDLCCGNGNFPAYLAEKNEPF